ncbi:hypothetical protein [Williamsia deligens]|uniref:DoxX-like family protein n=1 Tax=Williamsia deligens TaxID=321325 RepID=A0ABW3G4W3_9NOCA|nr:hypothetical protein [Williamsia deligens]MCP2194034.1 hypothetical protein [Williamsia deligens]
MAALTIVGASLAAVGPLHWIKPEAFEALTAAAFPEDTRAWIMRHGAVETGLGIALLVPATRRLGVAGLLAYGAHLGYHGYRAQTA